MNWLIEYYNAWVAKGDELLAMQGWHQLPDGTMAYTQVNGMILGMLTPGGFWFFHIAALIGIIFLILMPKITRKLKNVFQPHA